VGSIAGDWVERCDVSDDQMSVKGRKYGEMRRPATEREAAPRKENESRETRETHHCGRDGRKHEALRNHHLFWLDITTELYHRTLQGAVSLCIQRTVHDVMDCFSRRFICWGTKIFARWDCLCKSTRTIMLR